MPLDDYATRLKSAMDLNSMDVHRLAAGLGVTYQAVKKAIDGTSKALSAENNSRAAKILAVDPDWLATGEGSARSAKLWPLSAELLLACQRAGPAALRQAENAARISLNMDPLPRIDGDSGKRDGTNG